MQRNQRDVEISLVRKGFVRTESHHSFFVYLDLRGRKSSIRTRTSHGGRDLGDYLLQQMAKQCKISKQQFVELIDCPLTQQQYEALLKNSGSL